MLIDLEGRVHNFELPYSKALFPVFEAVINSIHSIQEARDAGLLPAGGGNIVVRLEREPTARLTSDDGTQLGLSNVASVSVTDDGIGFSDGNFESFNTSDSRKKRKLGGRGIGRFTWLKAFTSADIASVYEVEPGLTMKREFTFRLPEGVVRQTAAQAAAGTARQTVVSLLTSRPRYSEAIPKRSEVIARRIIEHCLDYFAVGEAPHIVVEDPGNDQVDLNALYDSEVKGSASVEPFDLGGKPLQVTHTMIAARGAIGHQLHFCANRRVVKTESLDHHLVDLDQPLAQPGGPTTQRYYYAGYVSGSYLDESVTPDRTDFTIARAGDLLPDGELSWKNLVDGCVERVHHHLDPYIGPLRDEKTSYITNYVQHERPIYRTLLRHRPEVINSIPRNLPKDRLDVELYKHQQAYESDLRQQGAKVIEFVDTLEGSALEDYLAAMQAFLEQWNEVGVGRLAEYIVHRRATLKLLEKTLASTENGEYALESAIHRIIFPMQSTSDDVAPDQMNLWIIDEKLAYHHYLASDVLLKRLQPVDVAGAKRPDLVVFNRPIAFSDTSTNSGQDSITIVEFKRPLRDDYDDSHNPITQVYDYVERIRAGKVRDRAGKHLSVPDSVRFYVYVICDLTPTLRAQARAANLTTMPDGQGFFGWNTEYRSYVEIISFGKLVSDAALRNRILFDKLENRS